METIIKELRSRKDVIENSDRNDGVELHGRGGRWFLVLYFNKRMDSARVQITPELIEEMTKVIRKVS